MSPHLIALAVPTTPKWLEVHANVFHTGTAPTVVTTLVIVTLSVMAVTVQPLQTATTVSSTPHGAQDSVPVTTHTLVRNVTIVSIPKPQPPTSNSSPNRTTPMMSTVMDTACHTATIVPTTSKTLTTTMLMMDTITPNMMDTITTTLMITTTLTAMMTTLTAMMTTLMDTTTVTLTDTTTTTWAAITTHMMTIMVDTTHMITDMLMTTTVATATPTVTQNVSVDVPDQTPVTVLLASATPILTNTATVSVTHTGPVRLVIPTADPVTTNATAVTVQRHLTVATAYHMLTGTTIKSVPVKKAGSETTALNGLEPVHQLVSQTCVTDHLVETVRSVLTTPHGTNTDTVSVTATGPENPAMYM
jgi:hypothetical protein